MKQMELEYIRLRIKQETQADNEYKPGQRFIHYEDGKTPVFGKS